MKLLPVVHANQLCDIVQAVHADELKHSGYKKVLDYVSASFRFRNRANNVERTCTYMKLDEVHGENEYLWVSWLPRIMFSTNFKRHEGIKDLPYRVVFGRYPPVGIFPRAEKHCVDEEDLPITSTCENPHTAKLRTEPCLEQLREISVGGDLQSYDGSVAVVRGDITLSHREAAQKFNSCNKFTKSCCKFSSGCKTNRCICRKKRNTVLLHLP